MGGEVLVGVGAALQVLPQLRLLLVGCRPVIVAHHVQHPLRDVARALEEVHLLSYIYLLLVVIG